MPVTQKLSHAPVESILVQVGRVGIRLIELHESGPEVDIEFAIGIVGLVPDKHLQKLGGVWPGLLHVPQGLDRQLPDPEVVFLIRRDGQKFIGRAGDLEILDGVYRADALVGRALGEEIHHLGRDIGIQHGKPLRCPQAHRRQGTAQQAQQRLDARIVNRPRLDNLIGLLRRYPERRVYALAGDVNGASADAEVDKVAAGVGALARFGFAAPAQNADMPAVPGPGDGAKPVDLAAIGPGHLRAEDIGAEARPEDIPPWSAMAGKDFLARGRGHGGIEACALLVAQ